MSDVIKLSEDFTSQIFVNSYKENTFSLNKVSISTFNDNWVTIDWEKFWEDTWKTFWFTWRTNFSKWMDKYDLDIDYNHYTTWEQFVYDNNWVRQWAETNFDNASRIDQLDLWLKKEVYSDQDIDWNWTKIKLWWWIQALWNYWWQRIQKEWHKTTDVYEHVAAYEDVSWITADLRWSIDSNKFVVWNNNSGWVYVNAWLNAKLALDNKYWESNIWWKIWIWSKFAWMNIETGYTREKIYWPTGSSTIQWSLLDNTNKSWRYVEIWAKIPFLEQTSLKYRYEDNKNWNDYMTIWVEYKF